MKLKKTLSAILAGIMLVGGAVSASAGNVYTAEDFKKPVTNYCVKPYYYNGYYYNWIYDDFKLEANWNPITGRYDYCSCAYCQGLYTPSDYYWVNGVLCSAKDYYVNYAPHEVIVTPSTTVVTPVTNGESSKESGLVYNQSSIPSAAIKRNNTPVISSDVTSDNIHITDNGKVYVKNPAILGGFNSCLTIPGKYYAYDKVDLNAFFAKNTFGVNMYPGDVQTFGTGFKMISSNSKVVKIFTDKDGQHMQAAGAGAAYVYLYTGGGVPFMRLEVLVTAGAYNVARGYIDVEPASWNLTGAGDSTDLVVKADKNYSDIKLEVVKGNGYIGSDGKLYANGNGAIVVKAFSEKYPSVKGYAIVYAGQYVNALYDGYWTSVNGCITGTYWNPYLWSCDGYKINGWVLTSTGAYLPVISKVESTLKPGTTTTVYSDLYDLLADCHGDVDTLYKLLWQKYQNNKPVESFDKLYQAALEEIMQDIADAYYKQMH